MEITLSSFRKLAAKVQERGWTAVVSIANHDGTMGHVVPDLKCLTLAIADVYPARTNDKPLCTGDDILRLVKFAREDLEDSDRVIFQCGKGKSRSTAAAMIVLRARGGKDRAAVKAVLEVAGEGRCTPNAWMLRLADAIMGSGLLRECRRLEVAVKGMETI